MAKKILIIGAGRSAYYLIDYLIEAAQRYAWQVVVADISVDAANAIIKQRPSAKAIAFDVNDESARNGEIKNANIVVSMLPAFMHLKVAQDCLKYKKHLVTASYVSPEIAALNDEAKKNGLIFLNEMGLDPGIDHMSAMEIINKIKEEDGEIISFKSYTGGLIAPESNDTPWGYKFSWNPRNVILAGQGTASYLKNGKNKYIPYNRIFTEIENISVAGHGSFDGYANRDSLSYKSIYGLDNVQTMIRGTLRMPGFCKAWNAFVKLGWTDDSYKIELEEGITYAELLKSYLSDDVNDVRASFSSFINERNDSDVMKKIDWLDVFGDKKIGLNLASPAQILQHLLEEKWKLKETDKDMIVMQHEFIYSGEQDKNKYRKTTSSLVVTGENNLHTAMAKTVGLPAAIAVKNILTGIIKSPGVLIPVHKEIYEPVLKELKTMNIVFEEKAE